LVVRLPPLVTHFPFLLFSSCCSCLRHSRSHCRCFIVLLLLLLTCPLHLFLDLICVLVRVASVHPIILVSFTFCFLFICSDFVVGHVSCCLHLCLLFTALIGCFVIFFLSSDSCVRWWMAHLSPGEVLTVCLMVDSRWEKC
jgi:hypothetical protein